MDRNYWRDYWDNYYKFMAVYLNELQNSNPNQDLTNDYVEVATMFAPPMDFSDYTSYEEYFENYSDYYDDDDYYYENDDYDDEIYYDNNQTPSTKISPGGGKFTVDNCKKMALVKIEMKKNYYPSRFFMLVDKSDKKSIQGYRIVCDDERIKFKALAIDYKDIRLIECVF